MTDRRLVQVNGWIEGGSSEGVPDTALAFGSPKRLCSGSSESSWRMMPASKPDRGTVYFQGLATRTTSAADRLRRSIGRGMSPARIRDDLETPARPAVCSLILLAVDLGAVAEGTDEVEKRLAPALYLDSFWLAAMRRVGIAQDVAALDPLLLL